MTLLYVYNIGIQNYKSTKMIKNKNYKQRYYTNQTLQNKI